ncbi:M50 family metallopeptidase [Patescibacteria group bacterium]|nr:M50 family metallopeptidase [Patescibacteria group bacterium]MBU0777167.1 M50 family metallopeptidase [Patescibacteria group bacterium]MBU0845862.1 M50 family metallopeptidase [Patescibacteria group bacterium]MBU0922889.1 M50 family metallopeptidase [Patescibacteria group bacterium]MBU1066378.1 M50 family metallopeptidase [Patescibacteria group bacterium]
MAISILTFLVVLSVLILVHELGHYWAAKRAGVLVEEFGIGYPPRIYSKKIGETIYSINLLPFGGFVRLHGEMSEEGVTKPRRSFVNKSKKARITILLAGVTMNLLLAVVAFATVYSFSGIPKDTENVRVVDVVPGSPAQTAKILVGDVVRKVGDEEVTTVSGFIEIVEKNKGSRLAFELERVKGDEKTLEKVSITPREAPPEEEGPLGVVISSTEIYYPPVWQRPFVGIYYGVKEALFWTATMVTGFITLFANLFNGQVPKDIAGPVGIFALTSKAAEYGILALINFVGILSINLVILNILPFPALDGGRLLFIGIESVIGRKVLPKIEATINAIGMIILISLLVAITIHDVRRLVSAGGISGFLNSILR